MFSGIEALSASSLVRRKGLAAMYLWTIACWKCSERATRPRRPSSGRNCGSPAAIVCGSGFRNVTHLKLSDPSNLNQFVQQEVRISRILHMLDDRSDAVPLFGPAQAALAEDDQAGMHIHIEEFDEVLRVRRNDGKIVIKRIVPYLTVGSTA